MKLDKVDRELLQALQHDGTLRAAEMARMVGISSAQCLRRKRRLEEGGAIRRYTAVLDPWKVGLGLTAFVRVWLFKLDEQTLDQFVQEATADASVVECHLMNEGCDFLLRVVANSRNDLESFAAALKERFEDIRRVELERPMKTIEQPFDVRGIGAANSRRAVLRTVDHPLAPE
jgi:DNA-binding Lrp family transcriptional regulator